MMPVLPDRDDRRRTTLLSVWIAPRRTGAAAGILSSADERAAGCLGCLVSIFWLSVSGVGLVIAFFFFDALIHG